MVGTPPDAFAPGRFAHPTRFLWTREAASFRVRPRLVLRHLFRRAYLPPRGGTSARKDDRMRAVVVGAGMGGLMTALALRQSGVFASIDIYEQTKVPSTAGAGLNIPPNGARICRWLGVDLDGGDPRGRDGAIDGGRAAILQATRQFNADGSVAKRPVGHVTSAGAGAGVHPMHRLDLLMCLYKRAFEFGPDSGAPCRITVHMDCRLTQVRQT